MSDQSLPDGASWATAPLLNGENVGRFVWLSWNGNKATVAEVLKVGRTNITVGYGESLRVQPDGATAISGSGTPSSVETEQHRLDRLEANRLRQSLTDWLRWAPLADLRAAAAVAGVAVPEELAVGC